MPGGKKMFVIRKEEQELEVIMDMQYELEQRIRELQEQWKEYDVRKEILLFGKPINS